MSVRIQNVDKEVYVDDELQDSSVVIYFTALNQVHIFLCMMYSVLGMYKPRDGLEVSYHKTTLVYV